MNVCDWDVGNGEPEKVTSDLKPDMCSAGYQSETGSWCLGRMCVGIGAPKKVIPELKADMCTAGYQPATEYLFLERMGVD